MWNLKYFIWNLVQFTISDKFCKWLNARTAQEDIHYKYVTYRANIAILQTQILHCYFDRTFFLIHMPFGTSVYTDHINMCAEGNLARCHTFRNRGTQSREKSQNFTIFVIFDQFCVFSLSLKICSLCNFLKIYFKIMIIPAQDY